MLRGEVLEHLADLVKEYNAGLLQQKEGERRKSVASDAIKAILLEYGVQEVSVAGHSVRLLQRTQAHIPIDVARQVLSPEVLQALLQEREYIIVTVTPERRA